MQAHDDTGREIFRVRINTICPIEYADEARQIAHYHMTNIEDAVADTVEQMLSTNLGPIGSPTITHAFCARTGYTNQVEMEVETLQNQGLNWCGGKEYTIADSAEEIKSKFCCITGDTDEILAYLNLSYK